MSPENLHYLNMFLGFGAIVLQILIVLSLILFFSYKRNFLLNFINKYFLYIGFIITFSATILSLFYSEIIGFLPCSLCWYQRIFMFPLVLLFGVAMYLNDRNIVKYIFSLTIVGFFIAVYQSFFYYFSNSANLPCDASGISCYQRLISEFGGYISFPMFSLTTFSAILVLILIGHFYKKEI